MRRDAAAAAASPVYFSHHCTLASPQSTPPLSHSPPQLPSLFHLSSFLRGGFKMFIKAHAVEPSHTCTFSSSCKLLLGAPRWVLVLVCRGKARKRRSCAVLCARHPPRHSADAPLRGPSNFIACRCICDHPTPLAAISNQALQHHGCAQPTSAARSVLHRKQKLSTPSLSRPHATHSRRSGPRPLKPRPVPRPPGSRIWQDEPSGDVQQRRSRGGGEPCQGGRGDGQRRRRVQRRADQAGAGVRAQHSAAQRVCAQRSAPRPRSP